MCSMEVNKRIYEQDIACLQIYYDACEDFLLTIQHAQVECLRKIL